MYKNNGFFGFFFFNSVENNRTEDMTFLPNISFSVRGNMLKTFWRYFCFVFFNICCIFSFKKKKKLTIVEFRSSSLLFFNNNTIRALRSNNDNGTIIIVIGVIHLLRSILFAISRCAFIVIQTTSYKLSIQ